ncbi:MAG: radical SAM protein [Methanothrix sp.]|nr:radical SAM protein [Methanothrix sp.]
MIAFGPVPSRRLGRSLGINNIPAKICSYSCAYCQVGRTVQMSAERRPYYPPQQIFSEVAEKVAMAKSQGLSIDYLTFVPDGEPTLDINLGEEIERLRSLGIKMAVISNASLIWNEGVREDLFKADWVSVKVDSLQESTWRRIDRPHSSLRLETILEGIRDFARDYEGVLATESMLLAGINDDQASLQAIGEFLEGIDPDVSYVSAPIRPPAESWVQMPSPERLCQAYQIFDQRVKRVELLAGYEGDSFDLTGDTREDILAIASVHPMREAALRGFLDKSAGGWAIIEDLVERKELLRIEYQGNVFYLRRPKRERIK